MSLLHMVKGKHGPHAFCIYSYLRLQQARHTHQVSQREIAKSLGFSRSTVSKALRELERRLYVRVNGTVELIGAGPVKGPSVRGHQNLDQPQLPFMAGPTNAQSSTSTPDPDQATPLNPIPAKVTPMGFEPMFSDRKSDNRRPWGRWKKPYHDLSSISRVKSIGGILNAHHT